MTVARGGVALVLLLLVIGGAAWVARARSLNVRQILPHLSRDVGASRAPAGVRIRVQVLNTTRTRGLARQATRFLRDRGFDVVEMGTTSPAADTTLVLDRSGHPEWAALAAKALGAARSEARPDSSRYLDITVLVGRLWRPPALPLNP